MSTSRVEGRVTGRQQRVPRSGGRTVAQRTVPDSKGAGGREVRGSDRQAYRTQGSAALSPEVADEQRLRVRDSAARAERGRPAGEPPAGRARLAVAPPPPVVRPRAPFVALVLVLVVGGVLGVLMINTRTNENAFRLGELMDQQAELDLKQQRLEKQIAEYESPGNLEAAARKLGLVESGPLAYIRLPDGKVIGVPRPAAGQPAITSQQDTGD